jgi:hypothetical protein
LSWSYRPTEAAILQRRRAYLHPGNITERANAGPNHEIRARIAGKDLQLKKKNRLK